MKVREALKITGSLSKPSKMPGWAYGLPAKECKTGSKLVKVKGSTCEGCYVFKVVQAAQYKRLAAIRHELWTGAMATIINSKKSKYFRLKAIRHQLWTGAMATIINSKKSKFFRWHDSGDVQDEDHLIKIFAVCKLTPSVKHWLPTREAWVKSFLPLAPANLVIRFSAPMVDTMAPASWSNTSTVVSKKGQWYKGNNICPAPQQDNECRDCRACWDPAVKNVAYGQH